jgi:FKBP-type peptidyl-prolyl cis-trans isomerase
MAVLLLLGLGLAACGDDENDGGSGRAADTPARTSDQTETTPPDNTDLSVKPEVTVPAGSPPARLRKRDVVKGKGPAAKSGDMVTMHYVGVSFSTGQQFDASWDSGAPYGPFPLGAGGVIPGWDQGIVGMRQGGRRELVIPPELAYGAQGQGAIGPNETLIFMVDLVKLN